MGDETTQVLPIRPRAPETRLRLRYKRKQAIIGDQGGGRRQAVRFGRAEDNDLQIDDSTVSRHHGEIVAKDDKFYLNDDSSNGTLIVRERWRSLSVHHQSVLLEGEGSLCIGQPGGPEIRFVVEVRSADGRSWEPEGDADPAPVPTSEGANVFRQEGEYWTLAYEGSVLRIRDLKGLHYLAHLLRHPGEPFHALDLAVVGTATNTTSPPASELAPGPAAPTAWDAADGLHRDQGSGAGPVLDATAKSAYRQRIAELREELEEAEGNNDLGRVDRVQEELEFLATQLAGAIGLGGRDRDTASNAERARITVTVRMKEVVKRLRRHHPALGDHLASRVKTGRICTYVADPSRPVDWEF